MLGSSRVALTLSLQRFLLLGLTPHNQHSVPFHTAIPDQPLTTYHLVTRHEQTSDLVNPR